MRLSTKFLLSSLLIVALAIASLGLYFYNYQKNNITRWYDQQHQTLINLLSATLKRYESTVESSAKNALLYLSAYEASHGLPSNEKLRALAKDLSVSHFYVTDKNGFFIRNTEDNKNSVPNGIFSFCPDYRNLTYGNSVGEKTPILPSFPYNLPFKFFMIPNANRSRILEAGIHFDDFAKILQSAVDSSEDLLSIALYTPSGDPLGSYSKNTGTVSNKIENQSALTEKLKFPALPRNQEGDTIVHVSKIYTDIENCCECRVKNLLENGKYYYYLKTTISTDSLNKSLADIKKQMLWSIVALLSVAFLVSRVLVKNHLRSFRKILDFLRDLNIKSPGYARIDTSDKEPETKELAVAVNGLVNELSGAFEAVALASEAEAQLKVSKQVAHDIRSPLMALKVLKDDLTEIEDDKKILLNRTLTRITEILSSLKKGSSALAAKENTLPVNVCSVLLVLLSEKNLLVTFDKKIKLSFVPSVEDVQVYVRLEPIAFARALSNLIDNAIEAIQDSGEVVIKLSQDLSRSQTFISIQDNGHGIPPEVLARLGAEGVTHGKNGTGLGFHQAKQSVERIGGSIRVESGVGRGTEILLTLPTAAKPVYAVDALDVSGKVIAIIDDDKGCVATWQANPGFKLAKAVHHFSSIDAFQMRQSDFSDASKSLVICDYNFGPLGNSVSFLSQNHKKVPVVLSTNMFDDPQVIKFIQGFKISMVPKPIVPYIKLK